MIKSTIRMLTLLTILLSGTIASASERIYSEEVLAEIAAMTDAEQDKWIAENILNQDISLAMKERQILDLARHLLLQSGDLDDLSHEGSIDTVMGLMMVDMLLARHQGFESDLEKSLLGMYGEESTPMSDEEFGTRAQAWLLDNPEVLLEAMQILQTRQAEAAVQDDRTQIASVQDALFNNPEDGSIGTGEPVMVEFFDYQCGFCKRQMEAVEAFAEAHPSKKIILKEFPILGPESEVAARAALAVKKIEGNEVYIEVHNGLLAYKGRLDQASIDGVLSQVGLDIAAVHTAMQDDAITRHIEANRQLAAHLGVQGTPGWVFRDRIARGLLSYEALTSHTEAR
jgi:protein-disulfide isomerase